MNFGEKKINMSYSNKFVMYLLIYFTFSFILFLYFFIDLFSVFLPPYRLICYRTKFEAALASVVGSIFSILSAYHCQGIPS